MAARPKAEAPVPGPEKAEAGAEPATETDNSGFVSQPVAVRSVGEGPFLKGISDIGTHREITKADFEALGIEQDTLTFSWMDGFKLPLEGINPEAVDYLVKNEYGFSIVNE